MPLVYQTRIYRQDLQDNPAVTYVFGDNLIQRGLGGQAKACRGEPNAIGIPTKENPYVYLSDENYEHNCEAIDHAVGKILARLHKGLIVVFPRDGVGTGLADLKRQAPRTNEYLNKQLEKIHGFQER